MYEPEVSTLFAQAFSWAFFLILIGCGLAGYFGKAEPLKAPKIIQDLKDDKIQLGYIDDNNTSNVKVVIQEEDEIASMKKQIELLKLKKQLKSLQEEDSIDKNFFNECVNAMVGLGENKSESKKKTTQILSKNPHIKDVNAFIQEAYKS